MTESAPVPQSPREIVTLPPMQATAAVARGENVVFPPAEGVVSDVRLLSLPVVPEARGNLSFIEGGRHIPFDIARVYYLYDIPSTAMRGGHAHKELKQLLIAMSGSFDVLLDNGRMRRTVQLNRPNIGLMISSKVWREIDNFSSGAVCLVLASLHYDEADYYRDYNEFLKSCG
jgi:hypothetical protein